uniref:Uncharacterized protein n=1 Tax=Anopheles darlingi TaxID=43151 RepID=A0A2M4D7D2_ANODA
MLAFFFLTTTTFFFGFSAGFSSTFSKVSSLLSMTLGAGTACGCTSTIASIGTDSTILGISSEGTSMIRHLGNCNGCFRHVISFLDRDDFNDFFFVVLFLLNNTLSNGHLLYCTRFGFTLCHLNIFG